MTDSAPKLLVGLGNPGPDYAGHRHNVGRMALDAIADRSGAPGWRSKFRGQFTEARIDGQRAFLLQPDTYMNLSGEAARAAMRFYKLPVEDVIVLHDELDLAPGKLRVKQGGGAAGHNGLRSLDAQIGNPYWRVRIGIGHPGNKALVHNWVLGNLTKADRDWLDPLLDGIARHAGLLLAGDMTGFASHIGNATRPPASAKPKPPSATSPGPVSGPVSGAPKATEPSGPEPPPESPLNSPFDKLKTLFGGEKTRGDKG